MSASASRKSHWEAVYESKRPDEVSWFQPQLARSLELIGATGRGPEARVIDIGGGAATLVDDLLEGGYRHLTVLDISRQALERAKLRLGERAGNVAWIEADVTRALLPRDAYDIWHDRAVFHFLTEARDRRRYVALLHASLAPGGHIVIGTFGPGGPLRCSGLDIVRYDLPTLGRELGHDFLLLDSRIEQHLTPTGKVQEFVYGLYRKVTP